MHLVSRLAGLADAAAWIEGGDVAWLPRSTCLMDGLAWSLWLSAFGSVCPGVERLTAGL